MADASSSAEPLVQHVNADGETVATTGEEGDGGGPATQDATANLGTCDPKYWSCPGAAGYKVRGQTYLKVWCGLAIRVLSAAQRMCSAVGQIGLHRGVSHTLSYVLQLCQDMLSCSLCKAENSVFGVHCVGPAYVQRPKGCQHQSSIRLDLRSYMRQEQ